VEWCAETVPEPEVRGAAVLAGNVLRRSLEQRRREQQGVLFDEDELE
jgi:hypothetical protein